MSQPPPGLRMPAEFEHIRGVWLGAPIHPTDWPGCLDQVTAIFGELVALITAETCAYMLVPSEHLAAEPEAWLPMDRIRPERLHFHLFQSDRNWLRDIAPEVVLGPEGPAAVDWDFNGWGYLDDHLKDARVGAFLCKAHGLKRLVPVHKGGHVVLEGGAYDVNGRGTLLATRQCLLSEAQCRNPGFTRADYEELFARHLGATNVIWLEGGLAADDTHGHVDGVARFVSADTVVCQVAQDPSDENYAVLRENLRILRAARLEDGRGLEVLELPSTDGAEYANFLICGKTVIVPVFGAPGDERALEILGRATGRRPRPLFARDLILGGGAVHCLTHQIPAGARETAVISDQ